MDIIFYLILVAAGVAADERGGGYEPPEAVVEMPAEPVDPVIAEPVPEPVPEPTPTPEPPEPTPDVASGGPDPSAWTAEDQTPTGKMTSAAEVKPILSVTKTQWTAVRDYDGQDLLYFTNLLAWRCGLYEIWYSVNGAPLIPLDAEPCHNDEATPNALKADDFLPFISLPPGSVQSVRVEVLYDDLTVDAADYTRQQIQMN